MAFNEILILCIMCTIGVFLYAIGIMMLCGKGGILVAGYHYEPKTERAKKYHKKIMRVIGCWYLALVTLIFGCIIFAVYSSKFAVHSAKVGQIVCGVLAGVVLIAMIVHLNCSPKMLELMRKERDDYSEDVRIHESEDDYEVHESADNYEVHASESVPEYHNCPTEEESSAAIKEEMSGKKKKTANKNDTDDMSKN